MTDQTAKSDAGKLQITLVPTQIIRDIARVRMYGNQKYGDPDNWKNVEIERYRDALMRHLLAYIDDPNGVDEESGIPHYMHAACNMAFICELEKRKANENNDRSADEIVEQVLDDYDVAFGTKSAMKDREFEEIYPGMWLRKRNRKAALIIEDDPYSVPKRNEKEELYPYD